MAKKRSATTGKSPSSEKSSITEYRLRIDSDIYDRVKKVADDAGISINQLVCGVVEATVSKMHLGEGGKTDDGVVVAKRRAKCVFVGEPGAYYTREDDDSGLIDYINEEHGQSFRVGDVRLKGELWFTLDYSGRPVRYG